MGPGSGANRRLPPPPKTQPADAAAPKSAETCATCKKGKKCTNPKRGWTEYGCWCGGDVAPARDAGLEGQIPADKGSWDSWVTEKGLPEPENPVDHCCMIHDLELGQVRQSDPNLAFNSTDSRVAGINSRLAKCFGQQKNNDANGSKGKWFAWRGEKFFNFMSNNVNTPAAETMGGDMGYGGIGAGSASTGAMYSMF